MYSEEYFVHTFFSRVFEIIYQGKQKLMIHKAEYERSKALHLVWKTFQSSNSKYSNLTPIQMSDSLVITLCFLAIWYLKTSKHSNCYDTHIEQHCENSNNRGFL